MFWSFIICVVFAIALFIGAGSLIGKEVYDGAAVLFMFAIVFSGGAAGFFCGYSDELSHEINFDSTKHKAVQTDTTYILNNGNIDTLIHYQLADKPLKQ